MTTPTTVSVRLQLRADTAANWTSANPTLLANELGRETDTGKIKIGDGTTAWSSLAYQAWATLPIAVASGGTGQTSYTNGQLLIGNTTGNTLTKATLTAGSGIAVTNGTGSISLAASEIADSNISATAEIAVSKLADGTARQLLQTDAAGTGVEWASNIDIPGTLDVTSTATFDSIASHPLGAAATPSITFTGDLNTGIYSPGADQVAVATNGTGRLFIDSSGRLLVGTSTARSNFFGTTLSSLTQTEGTGGAAGRGALSVINNDVSNNPPYVLLGRSGAATLGSNAAVVSGSRLGTLTFHGADGTSFIEAATVAGEVDGTPGTNDMPGRLVFSTTADGAASPTERLRITSAGLVGIGTSSPSNILHVSGTSGTPALFERTGSNGVFIGLKDGSGNNVFVGNTNGVFSVQTPGSSFSDKLVITSAGLVGIGVTAPNYSLDIVGDQRITNSAGSTLIVNRTSNPGSISWQHSGTETGQIAAVSGGGLNFYTGSTPTLKATLDNSGRLLVGTSSESGNALFALRGNTGSATGAGVLDIGLGTTRPGAAGTPLGYLRFTSTSNTGSNYHYASITAETDGTSSSDTDIPGRLVFSTTADGASSSTERLRVSSDGSITVRNSPVYAPATDNAVSFGASGFRWTAVWAVNGTIQTSDRRTKTQITDSSLGSDFVKALRPVSYKWIEGGNRPTGELDEDGNYIYESVPGMRTHWGFIAQEVKQTIDDAGVDFGGWVLTDKDDPDSQQALRYDQFIAPLTKALQETMAELEALKAEVAALKAQ